MNPHIIPVKVRADFCLDGTIRPLMFRTENGPTYKIDKIIDMRNRGSTKKGGVGMRYTCRIGERMFYLYATWGGEWFIEKEDEGVLE